MRKTFLIGEYFHTWNDALATRIEVNQKRKKSRCPKCTDIFLHTQQQRADAERQARLDAVSQLLQMGLSVEQVAQALSLTVQEVEAVR